VLAKKVRNAPSKFCRCFGRAEVRFDDMPSCFDTEPEFLCSFEKGQTGTESLEVTEHQTPDPYHPTHRSTLADERSYVYRSAGFFSCTSGIRYKSLTLCFLLPMPYYVKSDLTRKRLPTTQYTETGFSSNEIEENKDESSVHVAVEMLYKIVEHLCVRNSTCSVSSFRRLYSTQTKACNGSGSLTFKDPPTYTPQYHSRFHGD
jgi:hypothetical protein